MLIVLREISRSLRLEEAFAECSRLVILEVRCEEISRSTRDSNTFWT